MLKVRELRESQGLSQMDLAYRVGVHVNSLAGWEAGRWFPRRKHLEKLAQHLGVNVPALFYQQSA